VGLLHGGNSSSSTAATTAAAGSSGHCHPTPRGPTPTTPSGASESSTTSSQREFGVSPAASHTSVGSVGPTLSATLLPRHFDLTPVMCNTTQGSDVYVDDPPPPHRHLHQQQHRHGSRHELYSIVTPENTSESDLLYGEDLALPTDWFVADTGPAMPPFRSLDRAHSLGGLDPAALRAAHAAAYEDRTADEGIPGDERYDGETEGCPAPAHLTRQSYSFTSRQQYEEERRQGEQPESSQPVSLTPYQPSREADLDGVGSIPEEELSRIFLPRRTADTGTTMDPLHRLHYPIPLDDRQYSIPSIHLANHLHCSTTSLTEDEDSLGLDDEASLSSRASSLYLPEYIGSSEGEVLEGTSLLHLPRMGVNLAPQQCDLLFEARPGSDDWQASDDEEDNEEEVEGDDEDVGHEQREHVSVAVTSGAVVADQTRVWRKRLRRQERALQWLQSVEADQSCVAEAASSKFLNTNTAVSRAPNAVRVAARPLLRQASSPPNSSSAEPVLSVPTRSAPVSTGDGP
jgi:hypothetical protein